MLPVVEITIAFALSAISTRILGTVSSEWGLLDKPDGGHKRHTEAVPLMGGMGGYLDNYVNAVPILMRYGIPAAFFVSTGIVGTDRRFPHDIRRGNTANSADEVGAVARDAPSRIHDRITHRRSHRRCR